jgi:protein tyrosine phosphatase
MDDFHSFTIRQLQLNNMITGEVCPRCCHICGSHAQHRMVAHFQFTSWPDHGAPESTQEMIEFVFVHRCDVSSSSQC